MFEKINPIKIVINLVHYYEQWKIEWKQIKENKLLLIKVLIIFITVRNDNPKMKRKLLS